MGFLDGRVAVVTGAGRGIGASIARLFATEGASVVVNDLGGAVDGTGSDVGPARGVVDEITKAGGAAVANTDNVADHAAAESIVRQAIDTFGKLDILVNVAGILRDRMIFNMSVEEWDAVLAVHLRGTFNTSKHAAVYWRDLRDAEAHHRIINFSSASGLHGSPGQPNYSAAKLGIVGLTYSCANALFRYGVTSNAIGPGAATRMGATIPEDRRIGGGGGARNTDEMSPDNVAPAVAVLASESADWCNGQVIAASGYQVGLYNVPQVIRQVVSPGPWNVETLRELMEKSFKPAVTGAPPGPWGAAPTRG